MITKFVVLTVLLLGSLLAGAVTPVVNNITITTSQSE
jgi:hypothetical protein